MSHESDSASRHHNMLKSLRVDIPHVGALMPAIGFVRQPPLALLCHAAAARNARGSVPYRAPHNPGLPLTPIAGSRARYRNPASDARLQSRTRRRWMYLGDPRCISEIR